MKVESEDEDSSSSEADFYKNVTAEQKKAALKHNECFVCQKRLPSFAAFKRHVMVHANTELQAEKTHTCKVCFTSFKTSKNLMRHTRLHTGL